MPYNQSRVYSGIEKIEWGKIPLSVEKTVDFFIHYKYLFCII